MFVGLILCPWRLARILNLFENDSKILGISVYDIEENGILVDLVLCMPHWLVVLRQKIWNLHFVVVSYNWSMHAHIFSTKRDAYKVLVVKDPNRH